MRGICSALICVCLQAQTGGGHDGHPLTPFYFPDHRPIGQMVMAQDSNVTALNPEGWIFAGTDTTTQSGIQTFQRAMLNSFQFAVTELQRTGSQGMLFWDAEGNHYPQPNGSFIGDPRLIETLAPEMGALPGQPALIDMLVNTAYQAGYGFGMTLRPQQFDTSTGQQVYQTNANVNDALTILEAKVDYAVSRWGYGKIKYFYVDSTVYETCAPTCNPNYVQPLPDLIWQALRSKYPSILFFIENETPQTGYWQVPYGELGGEHWLGPQAYGNPGVGIIYVPNGPMSGGVLTDHAALVTRVEQGDLLMYRAWFSDNPTNDEVIRIYQDAGRFDLRTF